MSHSDALGAREGAINHFNSASSEIHKLDGVSVNRKELTGIVQARAQLAMAAALVYLGDAIRENRTPPGARR
ncbi:hypothetical protein [Streptomyces sp. NBRC 109706]|uniref:hypothetical protein n=1 Tax=Streptomyces sp. NBRC 109706 TaxID=1550035 RepID=UPI000AF32521|nr:hypothetical protein [Streptomyces sp. NBRC 109706]